MVRPTIALDRLKILFSAIVVSLICVYFNFFLFGYLFNSEPLNLKKINRYYFLLEVPADEGNEPFNKHNWLYGTKQEQTKEVKKLVKQGLLTHKTKQEIRGLLETKPFKPHTNANPDKLVYFFYVGGELTPLGGYELVIKVHENTPNDVYIMVP